MVLKGEEGRDILIGTFIFLIVISLVMYISFTALLPLRASEDPKFTTRVNTYGFMLLASGITLIGFSLARYFKPEFKFPSSYLFNRSAGIIPKKWFLLYHPLWSFGFYIIMFMALDVFLAFYLKTPQLAFLKISQQINPAGVILLGAEPGALAETLFINVFTVQFLLGFINKLSGEQTLLKFFGIPLVVGASGTMFHLFVYGSSEVALMFTFVFWAFNALITLVTGSFHPAWIIHSIFNVFAGALELYSSDAVLSTSIYTLIVFSALFGLGLIIFRKKSKVLSVG